MKYIKLYLESLTAEDINKYWEWRKRKGNIRKIPTVVKKKMGIDSSNFNQIDIILNKAKDYLYLSDFRMDYPEYYQYVIDNELDILDYLDADKQKEHNIKNRITKENSRIDKIKTDISKFRYLGNYIMAHNVDYNWLKLNKKTDILANLEIGESTSPINISEEKEVVSVYTKFIKNLKNYYDNSIVEKGYPKISGNRIELTHNRCLYYYMLNDTKIKGYIIVNGNSDNKYPYGKKLFTFKEALIEIFGYISNFKN